ncbi:MAG: TrkH family potassium uptake protein [Clostridia bacterium]|nr:TrkH family potassium uptake protein [Clostridia bacterium]
MNYKMVLSILGKVMILESVLLCFPMLVGVIYVENNLIQFLGPALGLLALGLPLSCIRAKDKSIFAKEGFVIVALSWIILSLVGAVPFVISGEIPNYVDALFETVSGFTTTGASIMADVEILSKASMFWRLFTHWIGGMGVLVFVLAILPTNSGSMHVFRSESPGPTAQKLVSKLSFTARILYLIYGAMTLIELVFLLFGGLNFYDALLYSFSTAGTGGFSISNQGVTAYNSVYVEMVIAVFMLLFSINFNVYYLILIGQFKKAFKSEELRIYLIIVVVSTLSISLNILSSIGSFGQAVRYAFFQVTSIGSTTGLTSANYDVWPTFSRGVLLLLTVMGACAASTGGGVKVSRLVILVKSAFKDIKRMIYPRSVVSISFENEPVQEDTERGIRTYFIIYVLIVILCAFLLSIDATANAWISGQGFSEIATHLSATLACIGNVGPGIEAVGPTLNYAIYSPFSKILLSFVMLIGRLEIFPMIILFAPRTWKRG